jgi:hypothetical protein
VTILGFQVVTAGTFGEYYRCDYLVHPSYGGVFFPLVALEESEGHALILRQYFVPTPHTSCW